MIAVIDNYDSFTYNLVQYIGEINPDIKVFRNDSASVKEVLSENPTHVVISPGPCTPKEAGISVEFARDIPKNIPLLGVCLGHQSIAAAHGAEVIRAPYVMHGKTSLVSSVSPTPIFKGLNEYFEATRYHSLIVKKENFPKELKITAETEDGIIMALQHVDKPIFGIQFHPESILTDPGKQIIKNFLNLNI